MSCSELQNPVNSFGFGCWFGNQLVDIIYGLKTSEQWKVNAKG